MDPETTQRLRDVADQLAEFAEHLEGTWRVETTDTRVSLVMMSPTVPHGMNARRIRRQIEDQTPDIAAINDTNMEDPATGLRKVPDLIAVPEDLLDPTAKRVNSRDVRMVVEIVSPTNPKADQEEKLADYPTMGIPFYLLVDPREGLVTVYSDPRKGPDGILYRTAVPYLFGDTVSVDRWTLDTTGLVQYPSDML